MRRINYGQKTTKENKRMREDMKTARSVMAEYKPRADASAWFHTPLYSGLFHKKCKEVEEDEQS